MSKPFIMQMRPWFGEEEKKSICEYMDEDGFITEFKRTEMFEQMIADYTGAKHCVVVNNGTVSLTLAALACGLSYGDEVIVPNYTMIATPNSVKLIGAQPVFVDVEIETLCLDIAKVEKVITPRTKAIILVLANGRYPKTGIEAFERLAISKGLVLIEDAAQALGSRYPDGRHIGTVGDVGSFSFSAPKIISTGQGGCLVTNNDDMARKIRRLKDFGRSHGGNDIHDEIGFNFKFTELQACIGIEQMKKLEWRVNRKKEIMERYKRSLSNISELSFFEQNLLCTTPWFIDLIVERREELQSSLNEAGIGTRSMYPPINKQAAYQVEGDHMVSNLIGEKGLWLPSSSQLSNSDIDRVCHSIADFYRK
ncbi:DegT/DnrJ/EryC1/StrS family aminotransferase [Hahella ganghwensis]|uniref:DegT/DnrJ/EryC1/StrS family aminotransferase n=1 Tax=Hahella ganghwensis TaxID=286420 RepID=UPI000374C92A|nr:DegT/DnrJ/EryC1/StrS family aminotransferase [Hahella ganghwensis]